MEQKIDSLTEELAADRLIRDHRLNDHGERLDHLERWRAYLVGGWAVLSVLLIFLMKFVGV